jgi:ferredoxin--NADP+ reductase
MQGIPFDAERHIIPSRAGRIVDPDCADSPSIEGMYVTGWLKRGPSGIIGTNIPDANETVTSIYDDVQAQKLKRWPADHDPLIQTLQSEFGMEKVQSMQSKLFTTSTWDAIEDVENERASLHLKMATKIATWDELMSFLPNPSSSHTTKL